MIGQRVGNYRLVRQLGEGGMGVVYEAVRDDIAGRVAIKLLRAELALHPDIAARFFNEARAANIVEHPGLVKVIDYGRLPNGIAYLAMEYLEGESLHSKLLREHALSELDTIRLGRQIASALAAAHAKQIIHRDLKPENIFLVADVDSIGGERAKILDFGIAKLAREHQGSVQTRTNMLMGTPIYMSPEQCRGRKEITDRADVYALGAILYEMLAGRPPFVTEDPGEYISLHMYQQPPSLATLVPKLSLSLAQLVTSMLLKEPAARPSMADTALALKELASAGGESGTARAVPAAGASRSGILARASSDQLIPRAADSAFQSFALSRLEKAKVSVAGDGALPDPLAATAPVSLQSFDTDNPDLTKLDVAPPAAASAAQLRSPLPVQRPGVPGSAGADADATRALSASAMPTPAGQVEAADWQTLQVMQAIATTKKSIPSGGLIEPTDVPPRSRSLPQRLRRLRFRLTRQVMGWLGVAPPERPRTPSGVPAQSNRGFILTGLAVVTVVGGLAALGLRRRDVPANQPAAIAALPPNAPLSTDRPPPNPSSALSGAAEAEQPGSPQPPSIDSSIPDALVAALDQARKLAYIGDLAGALKAAGQLAKSYNHPAAWSAYGTYACMAGKPSKANNAYEVLATDPSSESQALLKHMLSVCRPHGIQPGPGGRLVAKPKR